MITKGRAYATRVPFRFHGKDGYIVLDQIRTVDKRRLVRRLGTLNRRALSESLRLLQEMFAR